MDHYDIFISYRRDGGEALACLISEKLRQREFSVFYDVESLRSGKFNEKIFQVIDTCTDVIVILPQNSLNRCINNDDWVRKEIAYAIKSKKNIIPIMMRNFEFPKELPNDIRDLKNFNGISANLEYFEATFNKLLSMLNSRDIYSLEKAGNLTTDKDLKKELSACLKQARENNTAEAKYKLAKCYSRLKNSDLNEIISKLYKQAANMGYVYAQNELGICYKEGIGVEQNIEKAFDYFKLAADQGLASAQRNLATCFSDYHKELSIKWLERAGNQGDAEAFYEIGLLYETKWDYDSQLIARKYYEKAAHLGYELALERIMCFDKKDKNNEEYPKAPWWGKLKEFFTI